jgi:uncharacterized membrane protein
VSVPAGLDDHASVIVRHEIDIDAPCDRVWALHTDVPAWPAWQTDITSVDADGPLRPGGSFTWTSYGFTVTSNVYAIDDRRRVLWGGTAGGITGRHEWVLTPTPTGTHVVTSESFAGEPVEADTVSFGSWLAHLKAAAEAATAEGHAR